MSKTTYRIIYTTLGLVLILVVVFAVVLTPGGEPTPLPDAVESVSPANGDIVQRQTALVIDMQPGYDLTLIVDGFTIPEDELRVVTPTGLHTWSPGPDSSLEEWAPGIHSVQIDWRRPAGLPDSGEYRWGFRVL